jgi:RecA-family ATPase
MRWCFENLLPTGLGLLVGRPKVGKSWLALQLASSVALGSTTLGEFKVGGGTALYCGLEDGLKRFQSRTKKQLMTGDVPTSTLFLLAQGKLRTLDRGGMDQLRSFLDKHPDCRLVVVDTLARFKGGRRPVNSDRYQDDVVVGDKLQRLALERDICLLFVHHDRKLGADVGMQWELRAVPAPQSSVSDSPRRSARTPRSSPDLFADLPDRSSGCFSNEQRQKPLRIEILDAKR